MSSLAFFPSFLPFLPVRPNLVHKVRHIGPQQIGLFERREVSALLVVNLLTWVKQEVKKNGVMGRAPIQRLDIFFFIPEGFKGFLDGMSRWMDGWMQRWN